MDGPWQCRTHGAPPNPRQPREVEPRKQMTGGAARPIDDDEGSYSDGSSYSGDDSGDEVDGTSPATIAQVS
jgi:hypothetical protein